MDDDSLEGKWDRMKGKVREHWGPLTDNDVEQFEGKRGNLLGKVQKKYGETKEQAEEKLTEFERKF